MGHTIKMFLKFGEERHINDLYDNGTIYMSPIQFFRKIEDGELRGDKYEGIRSIRNLPPGEFKIPDINFEGRYQALQLSQSYETVVGNIFSLYCVSTHGWTDPKDFKIDQRIERFGSHCLCVMNNREFLSRIEMALKLKGVKYSHNFVDYYDKDKVSRDITLFEKPLEFEYQKEFRIYVERMSTEPFIFQIGSLKNITEIFPSKRVIDTMELR